MTNPQFTGGAIDLGALAREPETGDFEPFVTVDATNVEAKAFERSQQVPVILMVGTSRSDDSEALKATFQRLATGQRSFMVAYVDADATPQVAQMLGVRVLPTVVALAAGRPVANFEGNQPADQLEQWVGQIVSQLGGQLQGLADDSPEPAEDPRLDEATEALNAGDFDKATSLYDDILASDPTNADVKQAKNTVAVLKRLNTQGDEADEVEQKLLAADAQFVGGDPEGAFDALLALVKTEPRAKDRLLELLTLLAPDDPRVISARTRLASSLF